MANGNEAYINASLHGAHGGGASAPSVRLNRAVLERGKAAGESRSSGSVRGGGGGGGLAGFTGGQGEDPGDNPERKPEYRGRDFLDTFLGNALNGGGQLTDRGKKQQAQADIRDQGMALYAQAKVNGASDQQAMQHVVATLGAPYVFAAMKDAKFPLNSSQAWQRYISGNDGSQWKPGPNGRQFQMDQTGKVVNSAPIPGVQQPSAQPVGKPVTGADGKLYQPMMAPGGQAPYMMPLQVGPGGAPAAAGGGAPVGGTAPQATQVAPGQQAPTGAPSAPAGGAPQPGTLTASGAPVGAGVNAPGSAFQAAPTGKGAAKMTTGERSEIHSLQQTMTALDQAKQAASAQGTAGTGVIMQGIAAHVPGMSGTKAGQYDRALDNLHTNVASSFSTSTRLKAMYGAFQDLLPGKLNSTDYAEQQFNSITNKARDEIAQFAQDFPNDPDAQGLAQRYNAQPGYWLGNPATGQPGMSQMLQQLSAHPETLSSNAIVDIYAHEAYDRNTGQSKLNDDQLAGLGTQMNARGLWGLRDQIAKQDPTLGHILPDQATFNAAHAPALQQAIQDHPSWAKPATVPMPPNPQGQQRQPPAAYYTPAAAQQRQQEQAGAQGQQIQEQQAPRAPSAYDGASLQQASAAQPNMGPAEQNTRQLEAQAPNAVEGGGVPPGQPQEPAAAMAAPSAAQPQSGYKPTSPADALNYNELHPNAPVAWQGNAQGGSNAAPGHPMNPQPRPGGNLNVGGPGNNPNGQNAGFTGQPDRQGGTPQVNPRGGSQDMAAGAAWSVDPVSFIQKAFGQGDQLVRDILSGGQNNGAHQSAEAPIRNAPGYNGPDRNSESVSGLGDQPGNAEQPASQVPNDDVSGLGVGSAFATPQQVIPIPPPQPADAGGIGAAFQGAGYGGGL